MQNRIFSEHFGKIDCKLERHILGDDEKMNLTVRLGKQFSESSPCLPGLLGTGQQGRYTSGSHKTVYPTSLSGSERPIEIFFILINTNSGSADMADY